MNDKNVVRHESNKNNINQDTTPQSDIGLWDTNPKKRAAYQLPVVNIYVILFENPIISNQVVIQTPFWHLPPLQAQVNLDLWPTYTEKARDSSS